MEKQYYEAPEANEFRIVNEGVVCATVPIGGGEGSTETQDDP